MCHLILLAPLLALPLFWVMPLDSALLIYLILVLMATGFYWAIVTTMTRGVEVGVEGLAGAGGEVVGIRRKGKNGRYLVRSRGELWSARCAEDLAVGERVRVRALDGVGVRVEPDDRFVALREGECAGRRRTRRVRHCDGTPMGDDPSRYGLTR